MEILFEFLLELVFEGSVELSSNKKVPKFIRYPLIVLIVLFFLLLIGGMFFVSFAFWSKNILASLLILVISIALLIASIIKFKKVYLDKKGS